MSETIPKEIKGKYYDLPSKVYYHIKNLERSKKRSLEDITRRQVEIELLNDIINELEIKSKG